MLAMFCNLEPLFNFKEQQKYQPAIDKELIKKLLDLIYQFKRSMKYYIAR